jgi:hypothetical protein
MEKEFFKEYDKIIKKDEEMGKDFNMVAYSEAKRAKYFFE